MYDTLKIAIEAGQLGNLAVALVPGMRIQLFVYFSKYSTIDLSGNYVTTVMVEEAEQSFSTHA